MLLPFSLTPLPLNFLVLRPFLRYNKRNFERKDDFVKHSIAFFITITAAAISWILSFSIAVPLLFRPFYYAHVSMLHLPEQTGWTTDQIHEAYNQMMDYCVFGAPFQTGDLHWSESGRAHFADCAVLFRLDFAVLAIASLVLLICFFLWRRKLRPVRPLGFGPAFWSGCTLSLSFAVIAGLAALNFNKAFVLFHTLFFAGKDNWMFDPYEDQIILILPQVFFQNCAILIVALLFLLCFLLMFLDRHRFS